MLLVAALTYGTFRLAERIVSVMGLRGMNTLSKVWGFLILYAGMQFVVNGILGIAADPAALPPIRDALQKN
jgi:multiple antibiotic resistance protein